MTKPAPSPPQPRALLAWATAPLVSLPLPDRIRFADAMARKISRPGVKPHVLLRQRAIRTYWQATAERYRIALVIHEEGETSDHLAELAHLNRVAASALSAIPGITLGDLYPVPLSALPDLATVSIPDMVPVPPTGQTSPTAPALRTTRPPTGGQKLHFTREAPPARVGGHPFQTGAGSEAYRDNRNTPAPAPKTGVRRAQREPVAENPEGKRNTNRNAPNGVSGQGGA